MRRMLSLITLMTLLLSSSVAAVTAQDSTPASPAAGPGLLAELGYEEIRVTSDGTTHDFPTELEAGRYHIVLKNQSDLELNLEFFQLPEGVTVDDVTAFFEEVSDSPEIVVPDYFYDIVFNGGPVALPRETSGVVLDLTPGEWVVNLLTYDLETDEQTDSLSTVTVTGEMPDLDDPAGHVEIGLIDMDFVVPDSLEAGPQIWQVTNNGLQVHHLILLGVPEGTTEDQVVELAGSVSGPPASPEVATPVVQPGLAFEDVQDVFFTLLFSYEQFNLYEVDLEPGTYAMVCFMPDPSGTPHVMLGMVEIVTVE